MKSALAYGRGYPKKLIYRAGLNYLPRLGEFFPAVVQIEGILWVNGEGIPEPDVISANVPAAVVKGAARR